MPLLEIRNLHASVDGKPILKGIDLVVNAGEVHAIMGPNGSGKSTLAQVLAGHEAYTVTDGSVTFNGKDALELGPDERAGDFAQAMMDLGATICAPRNPACALCPLSADCAARKDNAQETYPRRAPKPQRPQRRGAVFVAMRADGAVLLRTRPPKGLLGGMTEFPGTEWSTDFDATCALDAAPLPLAWRRLPDEIVHVFTHFALTLEIYATSANPTDGGWWDTADGLPTVFKKAALLNEAPKRAPRRKS